MKNTVLWLFVCIMVFSFFTACEGNDNTIVMGEKTYYYSEIEYPEWALEGVLRREYLELLSGQTDDIYFLFGEELCHSSDSEFTQRIEVESPSAAYFPTKDLQTLEISPHYEQMLVLTDELFTLIPDGHPYGSPEVYVETISTENLSTEGENTVEVMGFSYVDPLLKRESEDAISVNGEITDAFGVWTVGMYTVTDKDILSYFSYDRSNYSGYGMYSYLYDIEKDKLIDKESYLTSKGINIEDITKTATENAQRLLDGFEGAVTRVTTSFEEDKWELFVLDENTARIYYAEIVWGENDDVIEPNPLIMDDVYITVTFSS